MEKMMPPRLIARSLSLILGTLLGAGAAFAQGALAPEDNSATLDYLVMLSRHGVRPPLTKPGQIDKYSAAPWPQWEVQPGYLTPHGYQLAKIFGVWDRARFAGDGLFSASGCADAAHVSVFADSDERTRETGKALAEGMFPGCAPAVNAKPEGTPDSLFRDALTGNMDPALAGAAIAGRIGGNARQVTEAWRPQLAALDKVLAGCGHVPATNAHRESIFDVPTSVGPGGGYSSGLHGPLVTASTLVENLLLEYADGMKDVGWGCVDGPLLRELMQIDTANWNLGYRTPAVARMFGSNLLDHIEKSMQQHIAGRPVAGALGRPDDRLLVLVGHDTNIETVSAALDVDWIVDGRVDDTPPGGVLLFELWQAKSDGHRFVRVEYSAQMLEQMRDAQPLSATNPPARAPIFVPGCSGADMSCTWDGFTAAMKSAIDPKYVVP